MGRFANSWRTFKISLGVVKQDPELMWLPVLSFLASIFAIGGVVGVGFLAGVFPQITSAEGAIDPVEAGFAFLMYLATAVVQVFFYAAMVAGAHERLSGGDPTVGSALRAAGSRFGKLFMWALVVATVNVVLQILRERAGTVGRIAAGFAGMAWNLGTLFVVPVLMFEDAHVGSAIKRSGGIFKRTWGESVVGEYGIGMVGGLVTVLILVVGIMATVALGAVLGLPGFIVGIAIAVLAVLVWSVMLTLVQAVYKTELYRFASEGKQDPQFAALELQRAYMGRH